VPLSRARWPSLFPAARRVGRKNDESPAVAPAGRTTEVMPRLL
jgi:hypothetical protein